MKTQSMMSEREIKKMCKVWNQAQMRGDILNLFHNEDSRKIDEPYEWYGSLYIGVEGWQTWIYGPIETYVDGVIETIGCGQTLYEDFND